MITFNKLSQGKLDVKTGELEGVQSKPKPPTNIGMDTNEFHKQVMDMISKKIPIEKANQAIDRHPDITDKPKAKDMASAIYQIMESKPNQSK